MKSKVLNIRSFHTAAPALLAVFILFAMTLSSSIGIASAKSTSKTNPAAATLFLTRNGEIVATNPAPANANDLHYFWAQTGCKGNLAFPYVYVYFTQNGKVIGKALAPCKSNDFEFAWNAATGLITTASWTVNNVVMANVPVPQGSNDVHVFLTGKTRLLKAFWTLNGKPLAAIKIPGLVNDMHWYGYPVPTTTVGTPTYLYFTYNGKVIEQVPTPPNANDLHYIWSGSCTSTANVPPAKLVFTVKGQMIGKVLPAPCKANDYELAWDANGCITSASWTEDGRVIAPIVVPATTCVDDAHLYLTGKVHLIYAWWTFNGQPISTIKIPGHINDMHWYGYPTKTPGVVTGITQSIYR